MIYTNNTKIPLSMAVFLATDHYDYIPGTFSATKLLKPIRQLILTPRVPPELQTADLEDLVASRMGTAIHSGIELAWSPENFPKAMEKLGYSPDLIAKVKVNPKPWELKAGDIPVYMEIRSEKEVMGYRVTGKFDFVGNGALEDFKSTSTFSYMKGSKDLDYALQGSIYRWLNPDIITKDVMSIQFIFTDWQRAQARANPIYPQRKTETKRYQLLSLEDTQKYIEGRIALYEKYKQAKDEDIPECTDEELWRDAPVWKYYKNPANMTRSTKNFDTEAEAYKRLADDGNVGMIVHNPGQVKACAYCPAFPICKQKDELIRSGHLEV